tara:strand:- start:659 stop:919 length:261 start_codon:yes stop_codon:yes gene_type:complete
MFTTSFWKSAAERAIKTVAQALIAVLAATTFDWFSADIKAIAGTAATAGVLSLLSSIASAGIADKGTPSIIAGPTNATIPPGSEIV